MTSMQYDSILNDQENKVSVFALLLDAQGDTLFQGVTYFKTRGNDTFKEPKKPFTIKFPKKDHTEVCIR